MFIHARFGRGRFTLVRLKALREKQQGILKVKAYQKDWQNRGKRPSGEAAKRDSADREHMRV